MDNSKLTGREWRSSVCWTLEKLWYVIQSALLSPIHTADADATQLSRRVASALVVCTEIATSSRRLPTDSVDDLETEHSGLTA